MPGAGYRRSGKIRVVSRSWTTVPVTPPGGGKNNNSLFTLFRPLCPAFSFGDVDTYVSATCTTPFQPVMPWGSSSVVPIVLTSMSTVHISRLWSSCTSPPRFLKWHTCRNRARHNHCHHHNHPIVVVIGDDNKIIIVIIIIENTFFTSLTLL